MAQKEKIPPITTQQQKQAGELAGNQALITMLTHNATLLRREVIAKLLDPRTNLNYECGYPEKIAIQDYRTMFDREGVGTRVVKVWPDESWSLLPSIYETEKPESTEFEKAWDELDTQFHCFHYLQRIDTLSGIGSFGILLLGIDDGLGLDKPVAGLSEKGERNKKPSKHKLLYLKVFDESVVKVSTKEADAKNPRYGLPVKYSVTFEGGMAGEGPSKTMEVHWSRVIHIADNRESSEVFGVPRMKPVYNRLMDIRKVLGGSAEMFWKGGFPGYAFEINPELGDVEVDMESLKDMVEKYMGGLQRYLALTGMTAKSLQPQVADPRGHIQAHLQAIAISLSIPQRILFGSEAAKLASTQDTRMWNKRVSRRQEGYVSPLIIRPAVDRLIAFGIIPQPERYFVNWPDLNTPSDEDRAKIAEARTRALGMYVTQGVDGLIPPMEYLMMILGMTQDEAMAVDVAAAKYQKKMGEGEESADNEPGEESEE